MATALRALELFCGIGGFAAAVSGSGVEIVGALDHDGTALDVYRRNFPAHPAMKRNLEKVTAGELAEFGADLWWLSPPCQPYCLRGARRDTDDPRAGSLVRLMDILAGLDKRRLPLHLALENVEGFAGATARDRLLDILGTFGYHLRERVLCPTELGIPSRRPRYYLTASRLPLKDDPRAHDSTFKPLKNYLAASPVGYDEDSLSLRKGILERFGSGLRILDPADPEAYTTCFTSGYGKSVMRAGSYLKEGEGARYFSPEEIARLLHFPESFCFPEGISLRRRWQLIGNSLSVIAVRRLLEAFQGFSREFGQAA